MRQRLEKGTLLVAHRANTYRKYHWALNVSEEDGSKRQWYIVMVKDKIVDMYIRTQDIPLTYWNVVERSK